LTTPLQSDNGVMMTSLEEQPKQYIVAAVNGSDPSEAALVWAIKETQRRGCRLFVLCVLPFSSGSGERGAKQFLDDFVQQALVEADVAESDLDIHQELVIGKPIPVMLALSQRALLLVVGTSRYEDLGSVGDYVKCHSGCPVIVVPPTARHFVATA
jgi:nucleotide-binding universal stress UspA family protein